MLLYWNQGQTVYDDVDLEDMTWSDDLSAYTYECPCGDLFQISPSDLRAGEDIARCPSCTLVVRVVYDPDDFDAGSTDNDAALPKTLKCIVPNEDDH